MSKLILKREPNLSPRKEAFAYQAEAVRAIRDLEYAAIFHEQGLGKTKIAIDLLLYWLERRIVDTVLLVVKKGLLENWRRELSAHSFVRPKLLSQNRSANFYAFNSPSRVLLTHFEVLKAELERFKLFLKTRDVGVIVDEAAKLKNPASSITGAFFELAPLFKRRVVMTGTPVANRPYDIWAQIWFLDRGRSLGNDFAQFRREYDLTNRLGADASARTQFEERLESLFTRLAAFCVRERKNGAVVVLPTKEVHQIVTDWEPRQREFYEEVRDNLRAVVIQEGLLAEDRADNVLKRLVRLIQIASNPRLVDQQYALEPGKLPYLTDLVGEIAGNGEKCIVWTSFIENANWLAKVLRDFGARTVHGSMPIAERNSSIDTFLRDTRCRVLVATPASAKEGLTLTVANHVIFYDRSFSLDDYLQAQDRIHRISQVRTCHVYNFIMRDSVDEWVDALLGAKETAAKLAQGDISPASFRQQMSYDFGKILKAVLEIS